VVLLGYSRGLISSRQIERACYENVTFMALSGNQRPDHSTIATFVSSMKDQILPLFCDILLVCEQENLLGGSFFALDGVKLPANASRELKSNLTDNDSALMLTSGGTIQGYNGQALVWMTSSRLSFMERLLAADRMPNTLSPWLMVPKPTCKKSVSVPIILKAKF